MGYPCSLQSDDHCNRMFLIRNWGLADNEAQLPHCAGGANGRYPQLRRSFALPGAPSAHWWRSDSKQSNDEDYERT
jgi:hypothetical protein